ncbi:MAG: SDR family oxidoreductase [Steroidobacteraceae bacterium]
MAATQSPDASSRAFVVAGCGYAGARVAARLTKKGRVIGITRVPRAFRFEAPFGFDMVTWDFDSDRTGRLPQSGTAPFDVIYLVPPPASGSTDPRIARFLDALPANPARFVYIGTTGVYGDAGGGTVNEDTPPAPATDRARRRLSAENVLRAWCEPRGVEWVILRVPGIYGPGRLPIERLRRGEPALAEAEAGPGNRIHVDDLADACVAALLKPEARNRIYNVGDGDHMTNTAFLSCVARLAGLTPPPQLPLAELKAHRSETALSFLGESRRVDTSRLRQELGFTPRYAIPEQGIQASLTGAS